SRTRTSAASRAAPTSWRSSLVAFQHRLRALCYWLLLRSCPFDCSAQAVFGGHYQFAEQTALLNQLRVCAHFGDAPFIKDENAIGIAQRGQAMGHNDRRAIGIRQAQRLLHGTLADIVQGRGGLIEDQDRK